MRIIQFRCIKSKFVFIFAHEPIAFMSKKERKKGIIKSGVVYCSRMGKAIAYPSFCVKDGHDKDFAQPA